MGCGLGRLLRSRRLGGNLRNRGCGLSRLLRSLGGYLRNSGRGNLGRCNGSLRLAGNLRGLRSGRGDLSLRISRRGNLCRHNLSIRLADPGNTLNSPLNLRPWFPARPAGQPAAQRGGYGGHQEAAFFA